MIKLILFTLFSITFLCSCGSGNSEMKKIDSPLLNKLETAGSAEQIQFLGKCREKISDELKQQIESTGVSVQSVIDTIFTATADPESIKKLAAKDFIVVLELSIERDLKNSINNNK